MGNKEARVIGVVGHPASGKDSAAEYLETKGFVHFSSGDFIRADMRREGIPLDRTSMKAFSAKMRALHGNEYPVGEIVKKVARDTAVSGLRNRAEVLAFRGAFGDRFVLLAVQAPVEARYARILARKRAGDEITLERFREEENQERLQYSGTHEVDAVIADADATIENNGTKEEFFAKLDSFLRALPIRD